MNTNAYWRFFLVALVGVAIGAGCTRMEGSKRAALARDYQAPHVFGSRFLCGEFRSTDVCLESLRQECSLEIILGESIPPEPEDRMILDKSGGRIDQVRGPADVAGCVTIDSPAAALDYLRLFSSYYTVHLFEDPILEVHQKEDPQCFRVCLPADLWTRFGLEEPQIQRTSTGYVVTRVVIRPEPNYDEVTLYELSQEVRPDGTVILLTSRKLKVGKQALTYLGFPRFM